MNVYELMEEIISVVEGRKEGESTEDMKNRLHKELVLAVDKKATKAREKGDHEEWEKQHKKLGKLDDIQPVYNAYVRAENDKIKEAFELMEEILFELDLENKQSISPNKIKKTKKDENGEKVEVVSVADELFPYEGDAKQQFNQKILAKINDMIEGTGSLEDLIQFVRRGVGNKKVAHEGLDEAKDAKGYKENMDIANHYDHLYSKEPANSPDGSPNPVAAEWKRKYQEYFDKAMKCHYGDENKSKKVSEALSVMNDIVNTILERKNIFGHEEGNRGDLIDDVSQTVTGKTLNQHIENTANKVAKPVKTEDKIKKVGEALELMEQILMETSYERKMELLRKCEENADQANVNAFKDLIRGYVVGVTPEEKAKAEQDFTKSQAKNLEAQGKLNKARRLVQNSGKKKVDEAFDLMEEIINEVSAGYVKKKAEAVIDKRKAEADHAYNFARKVHNYEVNKTGDNKNTPMTDKADNQSYEKGGRWSHAYLLSKHLPDSKKSIKPMVQAAKKVADTRSNHHWNDVEPTGTQEEIKKTYNRAEKAGTLARTDKKFKSDEASGY